MHYCIKCDKEFDEENKFCSFCGRSLVSKPIRIEKPETVETLNPSHDNSEITIDENSFNRNVKATFIFLAIIAVFALIYWAVKPVSNSPSERTQTPFDYCREQGFSKKDCENGIKELNRMK